MARKPISPISSLSARNVAAVTRLATAPTASVEFGRALTDNPAAALAAKGITITPVEARRIKADIDKLGGAPGLLASVEVGVVVKKKF